MYFPCKTKLVLNLTTGPKIGQIRIQKLMSHQFGGQFSAGGG